MFPELFEIGPVPIRSYGLLLAAAFFAGVFYVKRMADRDRKPFEPMLAIAYIMIFGGVIGGRLAYILFHLDDFSGNWSSTFNPFASGQFGISGLNLYGGVVLAILGAALYCRIKKLPILDMFDYFAPPLGLGIALGRLGCFLNGCCFGTPSELPWAVKFPVGSIPWSVFGDSYLHPAQLYSALYGLGLFVGTHYLLKNRRFVGQVVAILLMIEATFRIAIEYIRYYEDQMYFTIGETLITYNLAIGVALLILGLIIFLRQRKSPITSRAAD